MLIKAPILTFPTSKDLFILDLDASANGIGAILSQVYNGQERVISYSNKTLNQAKKHYFTIKHDFIAVVYIFVKPFNYYLWCLLSGQTIRPGLGIKNFKKPIKILARWLSIL